MKHQLTAITTVFLLSLFLYAYSTEQEVLYKEQDGVRITYTKQQRAHTQEQVMEYLVLKIENRNTHGVTITWKLDLWYNDLCRTCDQPSPTGYEFTKTLQPGEVLEGNVQEDDLMLRIWYRSVKPTSDVVLTRFEFTNLEVQQN